VAHHVGTVLRARPGDGIVLFDGRGQQALAEITEVRRGRVTAIVEPAEIVHREPELRLHLAVALPKGARADWLFEHGTEIGVAAFHPVLAERSARRRSEAPERWRRIAAAAAGQCDRSLLPEVREPQSLEAFLRSCAAGELPAARFVADGAGPPLEAVAAVGGAVLLVGPEGGWTELELARIGEAGFGRRSLGPLTLRTETAALAGAVRLLAGGGR